MLGSKTGGKKLIMLLLVRRLHLQLCQWLATFIPSLFVSCGSWLTNSALSLLQTMRSSAQRRRLAAKLSRGVELAPLILTRTLLARPLLMPLPHTHTSPCTVQLRRRVVKLASPCPLLNASCTVLHMHCNARPFPAPPRPAVNVDVGAHSVAPYAHANCLGASGEVNVVDDGTRCRQRRSR